ILVLDLKKDTLLYSKSIKVKLTEFNLSKKIISIKLTRIDQLTSKVIKYKGENNFKFQFISDYFQSKDTVQSKEESKFKLEYGNLVLNNINFVFQDRNDTSKTSGMNFSNLEVRNLGGEISKIQLKKDIIEFDLSGFKLHEKSGLKIENLNGKVKISPEEISINNLLLATDKSNIKGYFTMQQKSYDDFSDFLNKVKLSVEINPGSKIHTDDLALFVEQAKDMESNIAFSGEINGILNQLKGENIDIRMGDYTQFQGGFLLSNLSNTNKMSYQLKVEKVTSHNKDLIGLKIPGMSKKDREAAFSSLTPLGIISYKGNVNGNLNSVKTSGKLNTGAGNVEIDVEVSEFEKNQMLTYSGKLRLNNIALDKLSGRKELGEVSGSVELNGKGTSLKNINLNFKGSIASFGYNKYDFKNFEFKGDLKNEKIKGIFELKDKHAELYIEGSAGLNPKKIDVDLIATVKKLEFNKINFSSNKDSTNNLSSHMLVKLSGSDINNLSGHVNIDKTSYQLNKEKFFLDEFDLLLNQNEENKSIQLISEVADVHITGKFNITDLPNSFRQYSEKYFPTLIKEKKIPQGKIFKDNFNYSVTIKNFNLINGLIVPDLKVSDGTTIEGNYTAERSELTLSANSKNIKYKDYKIKDWNLDVKSLSKSIEINTGINKLWVSDSFYISKFDFKSSSFDNSSSFNASWNNDGAKKYSGDLTGNISFFNSKLELKMKKIDVWVADSLWTLADSLNSIVADTSGNISINGLNLIDGNQSIGLNGKLSNDVDDELVVEIKNFEMSQINPLIQAALLKIEGRFSGKAKIAKSDGKVILSSDFSFENFLVNERKIGNGRINSIYDPKNEKLSVDGYFSKGNVINGKPFNNIEFNGYYFPAKKEDNIDISAKMNAFDITIIQPYLTGIITLAPNRGGAVDGTCAIKGTLDKPLITGRLNLMNVKGVKIDYLNTYYNVTGVINIYENRILLGDENPPSGSVPDPIHLWDKDGHEATVWGNIFHDNFKIIKIDFDVNANNFLAMNTTAKNNPDYFGKAYITGSVGMYGNADYMNMEINIKTEKNTEFNIPLSGPATAEENDFIVFINKDTTKKIKSDYNKSLSGINLDLNLEATPNATVKMIFDSKSGDVISARGNGNIKLSINTNGKFEMYGLYTLAGGDYMFSLENVISKKFEIISGSTIKWAGDPFNADINITAGYNQNSSLTPFFPSDSTGMYSKPVKASVLLKMKDKLMTPDISFGISLPTVDETTRQTVLGYINNDQEMNRQVFSLLLLKSFVTPLQLANQGVGLGAGSTASRTSSEMLSNQLSNWLSQLSTGVDISVNITPEQMDVALSKQLFNDRLSIDGNVGVNNAAGQKTSNMIGDIQVDYKVYPDGKLRLKGFNKSNDNTQISTLGGPFTQGMGIYYKEEFNTINDLYDKYLGWLKKKKKTD
ncbi:MAG: translocation/assembly module TamB domain-containing protein, partial [Bacteroidota bacterium]